MTDLTREQIEEIKKRKSLFDRGEAVDLLSVGEAHILARQLLATLDALSEAQAAQAGVVSTAFEAGAKAVHDEWVRAHQAGETPPRGEPDFSEAASDYASLADPTGVKLLAEMQAEIEALKTDLTSYIDAANEYARGEDTLRAQLAEAQKREAGLREALKLADAALTEAEAILGGEYGDHYGPLCETMLDLRCRIAALSAAPTGEESNG